MFRPTEAAQMVTPLRLQLPISSSSYGVNKKTYADAKGVIMANFKTFGGTEQNNNGVMSVIETAQIVCRYRPDITSGSRFVLLPAGYDDAGKPKAVYEVLGDPENIEMRNMFLKIKAKRIKGGA